VEIEIMNENETIIVLLHEIIFIKKSTLPSFAKNICLLNIQIQDTTIFIVFNIKPKENFRTVKLYSFHFPSFLFHRDPFKLAKHFTRDYLQSQLKEIITRLAQDNMRGCENNHKTIDP
jgi:hypothetical protein